MTRNKYICLITGPINCGKTTTIAKWITEHPTVSCSGFLTPKINGVRTFKLLPENTTISMDVENDMEAFIEVGKYKFSQRSFDLVAQKTLDKSKSESSLIIIDEIGPLELNGKGFNTLFSNLLLQSNNMIVIVRNSIVEDVIDTYKLSNHSLSIMEITQFNQNIYLKFD